MEEENLIEHFATTYKFISNALAEGGSVFIHCAMGKSRSATVLTAYLMRNLKISRDKALAMIRETRPFVEPNDEFMRQLELYQKLECTEDLEDHPIYQRWMWQRELELSRAAGQAPERVHFRDAEREIAGIAGELEGQNGKSVELRCKKCRYAPPPKKKHVLARRED